MGQATRHQTGRQRESTWGRRAAWSLGTVAVAVVLWLIGAAVIPRWWAQRVGNIVDGRLTVGALYGLFIGFVFTAAPLICLWLALRLRSRRRTWRGWVGWLVGAAIAAAPNLMTLGVVLGTGNAAHAGERILDVDGPGFRVWSLIGVILAVAAALVLVYLTRTRGLFREQSRQMRSDLAERQR